MSREWKPGDVAIVRTQTWSSDPGGTSVVRPLVAIDPEDREQVERLAEAYRATWRGGAHSTEATAGIVVRQMQAALREFADPTPPKPEEPTGLGAVVFARCACSPDRRRFVRDDTGSEFPDSPWKSDCGHHEWSDLDVRDADDLLSEGVPS